MPYASSSSAPERFGPIPDALRKRSRWQKLVRGTVPVMLVHPNWEQAEPVPIVLWMHGRTVQKEIDPGRYLRWMRAGIGACAIDLPGHGERHHASLQHKDKTYDVISQVIDEIDRIVEDLRVMEAFDMNRLAIGGMSAGGMAAIARLCFEHPFTCASVEATTGSWTHQRHREMFREQPPEEINGFNPITHLQSWREIPLQAFHARDDEWVRFEGQSAFIDALRARYERPELVDFIVYDNTGAPYEHAGFGRFAADAKNRQRDFYARHLQVASA